MSIFQPLLCLAIVAVAAWVVNAYSWPPSRIKPILNLVLALIVGNIAGPYQRVCSHGGKYQGDSEHCCYRGNVCASSSGTRAVGTDSPTVG
jgi:hypothetical protein